MKLTIAFFCIAALAGSSAAFAQSPANNLQQSVSLDQYVGMPQNERQMYVAGSMDADRILDAQTNPMFAECLKGVTLAQATEIVDQSLSKLPAYARTAMPVAVHDALLAACNRAGYAVD